MTELPSIEYLKSIFSYDPSTGCFINKKDRANLKAGCVAGYTSGNGYRYLSLDGKHYLAHRVALAIVEGEWPRQHVDHINGDRTDNRLCNLRHATRSQNLQNKGVRRDSRSGIKGVAVDPRGKWRAKIRANNRIYNLGYFASAEEAAEAYRIAAEKLHGEFARIA